MDNIFEDSRHDTVCLPYFDTVNYLMVCLCPEDSTDLIQQGLFNRVCNRHNAIPLEHLIKKDIKHLLYYSLQTNGDIIPVPLKQVQDQLDSVAKELDSVTKELEQLKEKVNYAITSLSQSDSQIPPIILKDVVAHLKSRL